MAQQMWRACETGTRGDAAQHLSDADEMTIAPTGRE
jgi:hypothetical protein